ncbi:hypothetical protein FQN60_014322 [Etheostoma spectabile]|uniref:GRAM domain-containing protein n=1 Tax=Etheostoma spectabile TaxID=54343 RepID=A0A5J5D6Q4_9PERO|nr:hypothetical protein FQN60_014322 [Etheostoma spectabile]
MFRGSFRPVPLLFQSLQRRRQPCSGRDRLHGAPTMRKHLDRIRFRGQRRDEFLDLVDSPYASDTECPEETVTKAPVSGCSSSHVSEEELRKLKEESNVDSLRQELERERSRLEDSPSQTPKAPSPSPSPPPPAASSTGELSFKHFIRCTHTVLKWLYDRFGVYIEDFSFQPEEHTVEAEEPLSAKRLTENMRRLKRGFRPLTNFKRNLTALSSWNSVYTSAIAFIVYMYAAWHGWAVPMFLFLAILRLSLNCLIARGWRIQWSIVPEVSEPVEPPKEDLTVSEKFQLVLDVAQKAQNLFGKMANILEKIKNLFMWVQPELTQKLYIGLWVAFISSCLLPFKLLGFFMGVYAGIKFFIIDFIFKSCPKLRQRYDTPYIIWTNLPTDLQLKERGNTTLSRRLSDCEQPTATSVRGSASAAAPLGVSRDEDGGRHLCFESSSSRSGSSKRNKVIKLLDITDIQKYKVLSVLPGSGMGISIATPSTQKPMVFGAMIHRDEAFDAIFTQYMKIVGTATATEPET